jgi:CBS domain-containing protein
MIVLGSHGVSSVAVLGNDNNLMGNISMTDVKV